MRLSLTTNIYNPQHKASNYMSKEKSAIDVSKFVAVLIYVLTIRVVGLTNPSVSFWLVVVPLSIYVVYSFANIVGDKRRRTILLLIQYPFCFSEWVSTMHLLIAQT